jgi:hypothetical protein
MGEVFKIMILKCKKEYKMTCEDCKNYIFDGKFYECSKLDIKSAEYYWDEHYADYEYDNEAEKKCSEFKSA